MKVLFVHPPIDRFDRNQGLTLTFATSRIPPLSGITLASYLRKHGHETFVIDGYRIGVRNGNIRELTYREIVRQAVKFKPDMICVTMLTANYSECVQTTRLLRRTLPKAKMFAGGPHPSGEPVVTLEQIPELDGVGIGPGEDICLDLASGKPVSETAGLMYMDNGEAVFTEKRSVNRYIDDLPFPAWDLIDGNFYSELSSPTTMGMLTKSLAVLTSRGCIGNCTFCSSKWNRPLRMHSPEYVLDYCEWLADNYSIDTIAFWDDTMGLAPKRLEAICEGFIRRKLNRRLQWFAQMRANQMALDLLTLMKEAGCFYVDFGAESGSDRILRLLNKGITVSQNLEAVEAVKEAGLLLCISVILGSPTETEAEIGDTIQFCESLPSNTVNIGVNRFCPLPGSPSYHSFVESGVIDPRKVDWELLGNFSLPNGPCFADMSSRRFREIFHEFNTYCYMRNTRSFIKHNKPRYPEIVRLYQEHLHYPAMGTRLLKRVLRRLACITKLN